VEELEILAFLEKTSVTLRQLARESGTVLSPEMLRIADELAHEAGHLEAALIAAGLLTPPVANEN
jgi:hypothetical protein